MILWRNIEKKSRLIILIPTPDFPHFYYMLGGNLGSLLYGDVSVIFCKNTMTSAFLCLPWVNSFEIILLSTTMSMRSCICRMDQYCSDRFRTPVDLA